MLSGFIGPGTREVQNFPVNGEPDWSLDHRGRPAAKEPKGTHQEGGFELHIRGEVLSEEESCTHCQTLKTVQSCVVGPEYRRSPVWYGACSNYVWHGVGSKFPLWQPTANALHQGSHWESRTISLVSKREHSMNQ